MQKTEVKSNITQYITVVFTHYSINGFKPFIVYFKHSFLLVGHYSCYITKISLSLTLS